MNLNKWWPVKSKKEIALPDDRSGEEGSLVSAETLEKKADKTEKVIFIDEPYVWIVNDGLLRDEGVIFGISGAETDEKIQAIDTYYSGLKAAPESEKTLAQNKTKDLELKLEKTDELIQKAEQFIQEHKFKSVGISGAKVFRYLIGLITMVLSAYCSFYIVSYYIAPVYGLLAACGVFLFGLFAQMAPVSSWLESSEGPAQKMGYRGILLEVGPPVSAALLTAYLIYRQTTDAGLSFFLGLFLIFLFFFNGKLILGLIQTLVQEVKTFKKVLLERKELKITVKKVSEDLSGLKEERKVTQEDCNQWKKRFVEAVRKTEEIEEERKGKVTLFMSEYKLAKHYSSTSSHL